MNLWVRTLRQLAVVSVALFFFSCEDETSLLGFKNPNKKFHVGYVDIPLNVSRVLAVDSMITDLRPIVVNQQTSIVDGILVGQYQDGDFGKVTAQSFVPIYPLSNVALPATAVYDSITVKFRLNFYGYGFSGKKNQHFFVHELIGDTLSLYNGQRYYANSPAPEYSTDPLGQASVSVDYDVFQTQDSLSSSQQDTLIATGRLSDEYGNRVFEAIRAGFPTAAENKAFKSQIKGLAMLPGAEPGVLGMNIVNTFGQLSQVVLHYHTMTDAGAVADTLVRLFGFEYASFTTINADRNATELAAIQSYESIEPLSGTRYLQSGSPVVTKLDLTPFYNFADTVDNILINSAEMVINNVSSTDGLPPHGSLMFRLMNNTTDQFLNNRIAADREFAFDYHVLAGENYYFPATDGASTAMLNYDADADRFAGYMTLFAQSLFANKNDADGINENRLRYLALFPADPSATRSVTRTLFHKDNVSLRIYYTRPNSLTP